MTDAAEARIAADDGIELWIRTAGEGEPVVICCHGGPGMADYLEPVEELLANRTRVVRWDQRGAGRSDPDGPWSIDRFVADLDTVRRSADASRVLLLGHSWGANLALHYAQSTPEHVAGLLYLSGTGIEWWPEFSREHKQRQIERLGPVAGGRLAELRSADRTEEEDTELRLLSIRSELADVDDLHQAGRIFGHEARFPPNTGVNVAINVEAKSRDRAREIEACGRVTCPVLVVHGGRDPRPLDALDSLVGALPDAELVVLDAAGHYPWLDDPAGWAAVVDRFLGAP